MLLFFRVLLLLYQWVTGLIGCYLIGSCIPGLIGSYMPSLVGSHMPSLLFNCGSGFRCAIWHGVIFRSLLQCITVKLGDYCTPTLPALFYLGVNGHFSQNFHRYSASPQHFTIFNTETHFHKILYKYIFLSIIKI